MPRSHAVGGMTVAKYFSPFYDVGRRFIGVSPEMIDQMLADGVRAEMSAGNLINFGRGGQIVHQATYRGHHRGKVTSWVGKFNGRTGRPAA
ncbi:MAG TPA: hypothetical protein VN969_02275 [Streptosporangiaceae bacterium]|jgi:hypothetical protein|nr:hypothetical protein [Streptosporangiaceae bacterium]